MQFEDYDSKLRQSAEQHHPNYDEKAWAKMEKLLDRELPQKDDRRRRFIFLLLFPLLIGAGLWLFISKPWQPGRSAGTAETKNKNVSKTSTIPGPADTGNGAAEKTAPENLQPGTGEKNEYPVPGVAGGTQEDDIVPGKGESSTVIAGVNTQSKTESKSFVSPKKPSKSTGNHFDIQVLPGNITQKNQPGNNAEKESKAEPDVNVSAGSTIQPVNNNNTVTTDVTDKNKPARPLISKAEAVPAELAGIKRDSVPVLAEKPEEKAIVKQNRSKKKNSLFLSFSAGPDLSFVGVDNPGKVKLLTGAGIGYTIRERWTIRTGFYSARKVYDAGPGDYKPSAPVLFPDYLKNVSADCKVYEIPLIVAYNFGRSAKYKTFAAAGLSSIIMKKEEYNYMYLYPGNPQPYYYKHREDNKYKHYFSVLSLSGGYQRRINKTFSVMAEPYVKIPIGGVGYGKVKLAGAGVLFSVGVKLF